jgi:hypothetical protein
VPSNYRGKKKPKARKPPASSAPAPEPQSTGERTSGYEREQRHPSGLRWNQVKANVISAYGGICHLCYHPGAKQADHVVVDYPLDSSVENLRPAHGSAGKQKNPCPVCGLNCNQVRGSLTAEAGRRKIQRRIEAMGLTSEVNEPFDW